MRYENAGLGETRQFSEGEGEVGAEEVPGSGRATQRDPGEETQGRERTSEPQQHARRIIDIAVAGGELLEAFAAQGADDALDLAVAEGKAEVADA